MPKKILIIEDNEQNRILVRMIIKSLNHEVIEAEDGEQGIQMAREQKPDLVLMDIQMPVMDGYAAIKILKNDPETKDIKIIAVTSYAMRGDRDKAIAAGADDYMAKPIDVDELSEMISKYLDRALV